MSGYGYPQQPNPQYQQQPHPAPKKGMSTGAKIALGCGIPTALILVFAVGCTALVGKAASDVSKEIDKNYSEATADPAGKGAGSSAGARNTALDDVKVTTCKLGETDYGSRELKITVDFENHGDRRYSYLVEGEVLLNGQKADDFMATAQNLSQGQRFTDDNAGALAYGTAQKAKQSDKLECKILKASRHSY